MVAVRSPKHADASQVALRLLAVRARSRHELQLALARKGFSAREQQLAFAGLERFGYLDDARFARQRALTLLERGGLGRKAVLERLRAHGLPEEQAKRAVAESEAELKFDEAAAARAVLRKRRIFNLADARESARAARTLLSRGFSSTVISDLVGELPLDSGSQDD